MSLTAPTSLFAYMMLTNRVAIAEDLPEVLGIDDSVLIDGDDFDAVAVLFQLFGCVDYGVVFDFRKSRYRPVPQRSPPRL